jgi:hypothetical protein
MAITAEAAMARLADVHTVEQLTALIDSIEIGVASGRTLLFSGHLSLSQGSGTRVINSHEVAASLAANHPRCSSLMKCQ